MCHGITKLIEIACHCTLAWKRAFLKFWYDKLVTYLKRFVFQNWIIFTKVIFLSDQNFFFNFQKPFFFNILPKFCQILPSTLAIVPFTYWSIADCPVSSKFGCPVRPLWLPSTTIIYELQLVLYGDGTLLRWTLSVIGHLLGNQIQMLPSE